MNVTSFLTHKHLYNWKTHVPTLEAFLILLQRAFLCKNLFAYPDGIRIHAGGAVWDQNLWYCHRNGCDVLDFSYVTLLLVW